ncbi:MAG TPA: methylated-DNA--[protein]-cysteine S-methyltransferase [Candidatus Sulfotelmatobacter sp.]|nr:methylated-DNA--[protein]-cysteine S-methyltransferase [Candidatus Sulfotelmatobacter sp.]
MPQLTLPSPTGELTLTEADGSLVALDWGRGPQSLQEATPLLREAKQQLDRYFDRKLKAFDLPLAPAGSDFHRQVWQIMCEIPFGGTLTYGDIGKRLGAVARAVGTACGSNPIPIIIPCHRVLGAGGRMVGYSGKGGIETKVALLQLEGVLL